MSRTRRFGVPTLLSTGQTVTTLAVGGAYASALSASVVTANSGRAVSVVSGTG